MLDISIRSRVGNVVLGVLGVLYIVSASVTLVYYLVTNWGSNGLTDYVLQLALVAAAIGGLFFADIAAQNLKLRHSGAAERSRSTSDHQTAVAARS